MVFAYGYIPIGKIAEVYDGSSKVLLFSSPGVTTTVILPPSFISVDMIGRGAGNFEVSLPRDFVLPLGSSALLNGDDLFVLAKSVKKLTDDRDSYQKVLFVSSVNIFELKFVQVKKL
jgi:hypothetical protein